IELVFIGMGTHPSDRPLYIGELGRIVVALTAKTIVQHKSGDALLRKPCRDLMTFVVFGESSVAPSRTDHHGGTAVACRATGRIKLEPRRACFLINGQRVRRFPFGPERSEFL